MNITQIYISENNAEPDGYLYDSIQEVKRLFYGCNHVLYNKETARELINKNFDKDVTRAFDKLKPFAYKADLFRYCALYLHGGWYFDVAVRPVFRCEVPNEVQILAFRDVPQISSTCWNCQNALIYSSKGAKEMLKAIEFVLLNCKHNSYGINCLSPTGPGVFGRALAFFGDNNNVVYGDFMALTPSFKKRNMAFVLPDGSILAHGKPSAGGDLSRLGGAGTNNYFDMYRLRDIYDTSVD